MVYAFSADIYGDISIQKSERQQMNKGFRSITKRSFLALALAVGILVISTSTPGNTDPGQGTETNSLPITSSAQAGLDVFITHSKHHGTDKKHKKAVSKSKKKDKKSNKKSEKKSKKAIRKSDKKSHPASDVRKVEGKQVTLGAGTFSAGTNVAIGLYNVTAAPGQSGNFIVNNNNLNANTYNEILGTSSGLGGSGGLGVPSIRVQIVKGDQIQISGLSQVTFTPVTTPYIRTHTPVTLGAGTWVVGQDIGAGRYVAKPAPGQSGNFIVSGNIFSTNTYNEVLGNSPSLGEVPSLTVDLSNGRTIQISGMYNVTMTPVGK